MTTNTMSAEDNNTGLEIAIVGISCEFPGCTDYREFWQNLAAGKELIRTYSQGELVESGVSPEDAMRPTYIKRMGILEGKEFFDNSFFGYTPEEASLMDPQTRLMHQHCWAAMEDAGCASQADSKKIGLFVGSSENNSWKIYVHERVHKSTLDPFYASQLASQIFCNTLVSYKLNLRGPSYFVDTACSTSLAAVHLACKSLLTHECSIALAGGVFVSSMRQRGYFYQEGMVLSRDGYCRPFDSEATGTAKGEGIGIVALKRLSSAVKDRDHIYAVIKSSAVNNDGNSKIGFTAPSVRGQSDCVRMAYKLADISPASVSYVEAHGTGTRLGDPVEIRALNEAFGVKGSKSCAIGSVKSNLGHANVAAGIAGLIKTALCLKYKILLPSLHFKKPNPEIDFDGGPFFVNTETRSWQRTKGHLLRAGVNSLGIGGTNVHAVLEESITPTLGAGPRSHSLLLLSAKSEAALRRFKNDFKRFAMENTELNPADIAYTMQVGRQFFPVRDFIVFDSIENLCDRLTASEVSSRSKTFDSSPQVVFMFPGQGSQFVNMGKTLYETEPVFRAEMNRGLSIIERSFPAIRNVLFGDHVDQSQLNQTKFTQPLVFLFEWCLAQLLRSIGIQPSVLIGHSLGEYVAACIGGALSFEEGLRLVLRRAELMDQMESGEMMAVAVNENAARGFLSSKVSLAAMNSPGQVVLSGEAQAMASLRSTLKTLNIACTLLPTSKAFHSSMVNGIATEFYEEVRKIKFKPLEIPIVSNLTGRFIQNSRFDANYWIEHMKSPVRFSDGIECLLKNGKQYIFIEVGPGGSLAALVKQHRRPGTSKVFTLVKNSSIESQEPHYLQSIGELWSHGVPIDWETFNFDGGRQKISLPTYSFERSKFPGEVDIALNSTRPASEVDTYAYTPLKDERPALANDFMPPQTETEKKLVSIAEDVLGFTPIGLEDSFFELGGDSLKAMAILRRISKEFLVEMQLADFFECNNLKKVALQVEAISWLKNDIHTNNEIKI